MDKLKKELLLEMYTYVQGHIMKEDTFSFDNRVSKKTGSIQA